MYKIFIRSILAIVFTFGGVSCNDNSPNEPSEIKPHFLGFDGKIPTQLYYEDPYLYVCAASDGLWRFNASASGDWEYLGLRDSSSGKYPNVGVVDADIYGDTILAAYNVTNVPHDSMVSIWRSNNGGNSWLRSDSGIPETVPYYDNNILSGIKRSRNNPRYLIGSLFPAIYLSKDGGYKWELIMGRRGVLSGGGQCCWNPHIEDEVWFFGESAIFSPYLIGYNNYGGNLKIEVNFERDLEFPSDGKILDIAFDPVDPNLMYAATTNGVIKSIDGGFTWIPDAFNVPANSYARRIISHPVLSKTLFLVGQNIVYMTSDGGENVNLLCRIDEDRNIISLAYDVKNNRLFLGSTKGIYMLSLK